MQTVRQQIVSTLLSTKMNPANILKFLSHHSENWVCFHTLLTDAETIFSFYLKPSLFTLRCFQATVQHVLCILIAVYPLLLQQLKILLGSLTNV